jgi:hypothetical protein
MTMVFTEVIQSKTCTYYSLQEGKKQKKKKKGVKQSSVDHVHETKGQGRALKYLDAWSENQVPILPTIIFSNVICTYS